MRAAKGERGRLVGESQIMLTYNLQACLVATFERVYHRRQSVARRLDDVRNEANW